MHRLFVILSALVVSACGDSTGVDEIPDISGDWTYNLTFSRTLAPERGSCTYSPSPVTITQMGGTFTGRIEIPDATCELDGNDPFSLGSWGADIVSGTINAAGAVSFQWGDFDTVYHTGQLSGGSMSGTITATNDDGTLSGPWSLSR
jgi:hypothetical protein